MADLATTADVEGLWRSLTAAESTVAANQLRFASAIVRQQVRDIDDRITSGDIDADLVSGVVAEMVIRKLKNPDGKRSEQIDDYGFTRDNQHSAGGLYLTDEELALLRGSRPGSFSITPHRPDPTEADHERIAQHRAAWGR